jgi:hypothetical protein
MAGRLECPDTDTAKMPKAGTMPHCSSSWPGAGCSTGSGSALAGLTTCCGLTGAVIGWHGACQAERTCRGAAVRWGSAAAAAHTENMTTNVLTNPSHDRWLSCRSEGMNSSGATATVATAAERCSGAMPQAPTEVDSTHCQYSPCCCRSLSCCAGGTAPRACAAGSLTMDWKEHLDLLPDDCTRQRMHVLVRCSVTHLAKRHSMRNSTASHRSGSCRTPQRIQDWQSK